MKRFTFKIIVFLVIAEAAGWVLLARQRYWYSEAAEVAARERVGFVFIGSSRVAQAVVPDAFASELGDVGGRVVNLGRGYSTLAEHVLGLRRLAAASPRGLMGTVVFLEAPEGVPDLATWNDPWFHPEHPGLLRMTMRTSDLPAFWSHSTATFEDKVSITIGRISSVAGLRGSWSYYARSAWHSPTVRMAGDGVDELDLSQAGGVRTGGEMHAVAADLAESMSRQAVLDQRELVSRDVEHSILLDLASFLKREGAEFVVFRMPMSSVQRRPYATPIGQRNRAFVAAALADAGVTVLQVGFPTTDDDFPDLWHLRQSRARDFSRTLAAAYLARHPKPGSSRSQVR